MIKECGANQLIIEPNQSIIITILKECEIESPDVFAVNDGTEYRSRLQV
jgi:hypothetical protein